MCVGVCVTFLFYPISMIPSRKLYLTLKKKKNVDTIMALNSLSKHQQVSTNIINKQKVIILHFIVFSVNKHEFKILHIVVGNLNFDYCTVLEL